MVERIVFKCNNFFFIGNSSPVKNDCYSEAREEQEACNEKYIVFDESNDSSNYQKYDNRDNKLLPRGFIV